jgi:hypothetical protein
MNDLKVFIADPCFDERSIANPVIPHRQERRGRCKTFHDY